MSARFLISTLTDFPDLKDPRGKVLPEIAIVGKSNVGKSSLINHLFNQKRLAKTSSTPGKTRLLNFFSVEDRYLFVDLPGYGFAKAPKNEIEAWSHAIDSYLNERKGLRLILLLVDSRRDFSPEDLTMTAWTEEKQIPLLLVFTKTDKLSHSELESLRKRHPEAILYSVTQTLGKHLVHKKIEEKVRSWA